MEFLNTGPGYGYLVQGSEGLNPETALNFSLGVEWTGVRAYGRVQAFENRYDNFIETYALPDSAGLTVYTYGNIAHGLTRGMEAEGGLNLGPATLEAGWSLLETEDETTGLPLLGRPRHSGRLTASVALPLELRARVSALHTGATPMLRDESGVTTDREAYSRMDARLTRELPGGIGISAGVDNLFDSTPARWPGFTGRRLYLTLRAGLRWGAGEP